MLTVSILISGQPIMARSAVHRDGHTYEVDDGTTVDHCPDDGDVALAHKLLDTIKEQR